MLLAPASRDSWIPAIDTPDAPACHRMLFPEEIPPSTKCSACVAVIHVSGMPAACSKVGIQDVEKTVSDAIAYHEFPADLLDLEHACPKGYNFLATGTSTWQAVNDDRGCDLPPFHRTYSIPVTARRPIDVSIKPSPERFPTWFDGQRNHICVLTLAWAYVLSARWAEVAVWKQPGDADTRPRAISVELGPASDSAARWWAAVLAPNQGWTTGITHNGGLLIAPWSTNMVQTGQSLFVLSRTSTMAAPPPHLHAPSFSIAASYISAYSAYHGVQDQSRAAFAAALMLPSAGRIKRTISLFAPGRPCPDSSHTMSASPAPGAPVWGYDVHQLDKLLTLSCTNFIQSLLSSAIFEPGIACNACGAWIQGAFAVLGQARADLQVLTGALMARNPELGFLWLGAALLDMHDFVLGGMRALLYPIDLTLAGWTDTLMSFIQQPVRDPSPAKEMITRADEARLLFLSQSMDHTQPPIVPFQPFGLTAIADCNLKVQEHARCRSSHGLYYSSWAWDCRDGAQEGEGQETADDSQIPVDYSCMDREIDGSETVTYSIFMWLRGTEGFTPAERAIREHEWINNLDESDDENASPEGDGRSIGARRKANVGSWMARAVTYRRNSFY
ncbi:hypothetical protein C8A03DRAFT_40980 [Achaetomium macrosporum]|uniref:Uncharacterized protein n=1 Tax=Achaetomium macrosporum TaxID=79813 RepID=A0AAN7HI88_9PEZI|nr:hypothetical protein C8A03DRAFT_40980 [Achaetomium macrosporum]